MVFSIVLIQGECRSPLAGRANALKQDFETKLNRSACPCSEHRGWGGLVRCCTSTPEETTGGCIVSAESGWAEGIGEDGMIEHIEDFCAQLSLNFAPQLIVLYHRHIPVSKAGLTECITAR